MAQTPSRKPKQSSSRQRSRESREDSEFIDKLVHVNRVAKVVKGGRRFSFAALVAVGPGGGTVPRRG